MIDRRILLAVFVVLIFALAAQSSFGQTCSVGPCSGAICAYGPWGSQQECVDACVVLGEECEIENDCDDFTGMWAGLSRMNCMAENCMDFWGEFICAEECNLCKTFCEALAEPAHYSCVTDCLHSDWDPGLGSTSKQNLCYDLCKDETSAYPLPNDCVSVCEQYSGEPSGYCDGPDSPCAAGAAVKSIRDDCEDAVGLGDTSDALDLCGELPRGDCEGYCETSCAVVANSNFTACNDACAGLPSQAERTNCGNACDSEAFNLFQLCIENCFVCDDLPNAGAMGAGENIKANIFVCPFKPTLLGIDPCKIEDNAKKFYSKGDILCNENDYINQKFFGTPEAPWLCGDKSKYDAYTGKGAIGTATIDLGFDGPAFDTSRVCYPGVEGRYWLRMQVGAEYTFSELYTEGACIGKAHIVSWDKHPVAECGDNCPSNFCYDECVDSQVDWKNWAGGILDCCGDDNAAAEDAYDCAFQQRGEYMCVKSFDNLEGDMWEWIGVLADEGRIFDMTCANLSVMSDGTSFFYCGQYPSQNSPHPNMFEMTYSVGIKEDDHYHEYACYTDSGGFVKIAECKGVETFSEINEGEKFVSGDYAGDPPVFCVRDSQYSTATDDYTRMTLDLDDSPGNNESCEDAGFYWTGTKCCEEPEPGFVDGESYNDLDSDDVNGTGGCWAGVHVASGQTLLDADADTRDDIANSEGTFYGCLLSSTDDALSTIMRSHAPATPMLDGNNLDYDNPVNNDLCHMAGDDENYCSFEGQWRYADNTPFYQKNMSWEAGAGEIQWECCHGSECWDGESCIADQTPDYEPTPVYGPDGFRCRAGDWAIIPLKHTWDEVETGYCPKDEDCLIEPDPIAGCLANGTYYNTSPLLDEKVYYCENGNWTSRTKLIALALLDYAETKSPTDFTLFCDSYDNLLNYYNYEIGKGSGKYTSTYIENCIGGDCVNDFCVLQYPQGVAFGTSLNIDVDNADRSFLFALGKSFDLCGHPPEFGDELYHECGAGTKIWYNQNQNSIIYLPETPERDPFDVSWADKFRAFRENFFESLTSGIDVQSTSVRNYSFFDRTRIFSKLYADVYGSKQVFAFLEEDKTVDIGASRYDNVDYLGVEYKGITISPCELIRHYEEVVAGLTEVRACDGTTVVFPDFRTGGQAALVDAWPDLTAKLRLRK